MIAVHHPQWVERPLAVVVARPACTPDPEELRAWLAAKFARWWVPDAVVFAASLPRTATGKVRKLDLREQYRAQYTPAESTEVQY